MILLARPAPHLPRTLQAFQQAGIPSPSILSFPLAEPQPLPVPLPPQAQALILTSSLAIPALPAATLPVYCVGQHTAQAAQAAGLTVTLTGQGDATDLAHQITQYLTPNTKYHFLHLHGDHAKTSWYDILQSAGHTVTAIQAYRTNPVATLPHSITQALLAPRSSFLVPLFSEESAHHLANLLKKANIPPSGTALCLSPAVARAAARHWPTVITAANPTLEGLTALLHQQQEKPLP